MRSTQQDTALVQYHDSSVDFSCVSKFLGRGGGQHLSIREVHVR